MDLVTSYQESLENLSNGNPLLPDTISRDKIT